MTLREFGVVALLTARTFPGIVAIMALRQVPKLDAWAHRTYERIRARNLERIAVAERRIAVIKEKQKCE